MKSEESGEMRDWAAFFSPRSSLHDERSEHRVAR
jgi:hypothetical protein